MKENGSGRLATGLKPLSRPNLSTILLSLFHMLGPIAGVAWDDIKPAQVHD